MFLKSPTFSRYRPRFLTLIVLLAAAATIVLANLSFDKDWDYAADFGHKSYGWPLVWHRYVLAYVMDSRTAGWYYSPGRLAGNAVIWLAMLAAPAAACEWLLRRYRPRLRWSLRTMLVATGLAAAFCGWFAVARNRAKLQDPLIAEIHCHRGKIWVERSGPKWLDLFGADRFRRSIVAASLGPGSGFGSSLCADDPDDHALLKRLARLPGLQSLSLDIDHVTPAVADAIGEMRQLHTLIITLRDQEEGDHVPERFAPIGELTQLERLGVRSVWNRARLSEVGACLDRLRDLKSLSLNNLESDDPRISDECFAAIGKMQRLEELHLDGTALGGDSLGRLAGLRSLNRLELSSFTNADKLDSQAALLSLPALPRLEALDLENSDVRDHDLRRLATLPLLKSLCLEETRVTGAGLAELGSLKSLEELAIGGCTVSPAGLEALRPLKRLNTLHMDRRVPYREDDQPNVIIIEHQGGWVELPLADGDRMSVPKAERDGLATALRALRKSNPEIVIDEKTYAMPRRGFLSHHVGLGFGYDTLPDRGTTWLPASEAPWMTASERADFESLGGWARFDAAGWQGTNGHTTTTF